MKEYVEKLSLDEIYDDYCRLVEMDKKYYGSVGRSNLKASAEDIMDILRREILIRTTDDLKKRRDETMQQ